MNSIRCVICDGDEWDRIGAVHAGETRREGTSLQRVEQEFALGACRNCGHVRTIEQYDAAVFSRLYAQESQQPVSWGDLKGADALQPYAEMVELAGGAALKSSAGLIIDVRIVDRALAGATIHGQQILSSSDIRRSMINFARSEEFDARLVDLYAQ